MSRIGAGEAVIGLAFVALVLAALLPSYRARNLEGLVESAVADVDELRAGMSQARRVNGRWPDAAPPGVPPQGVSAAFPGPDGLVRDAYALEWRLWDRVDEVPAPPRPPVPPVLDDDETPPSASASAGDAPPDSAAVELVRVVRREGAVVVHSGEERLLAELLRRYGDDVSFVRDTTWTLVVTADPSS